MAEISATMSIMFFILTLEAVLLVGMKSFHFVIP